jgi:hypothetical protein
MRALGRVRLGVLATAGRVAGLAAFAAVAQGEQVSGVVADGTPVAS